MLDKAVDDDLVGAAIAPRLGKQNAFLNPDIRGIGFEFPAFAAGEFHRYLAAVVALGGAHRGMKMKADRERVLAILAHRLAGWRMEGIDAFDPVAGIRDRKAALVKDAELAGVAIVACGDDGSVALGASIDIDLGWTGGNCRA